VSGNRVQRGIRETIRRSTGIIPRSSVPRDPLVRQRSRLFDGLFSPFGAHREVQNFANLRDDSHRVLFVLRVRLFADAEQRERLRGLFFGKWNVLRSVFDKEREEKEEKYRIRIRDELLLLSFSTSRKAKREKRDPKIESSDPRETSKTARNCLSKEKQRERERERSAQSNRKDDRDDDSFARTGFGVATTVATEATSAFFNISRRSNFSSDDFEDALTEIEEKDFREDDDVFVPLKRVFAVDATFVVVVTANIVRFLKGFGLRKGLTQGG